MRMSVTKTPRVKTFRKPLQTDPVSAAPQSPVSSQPVVLNLDDLHARIAQRAYELHAQRGYREGYAVEDWLEAERELLGLECHA